MADHAKAKTGLYDRRKRRYQRGGSREDRDLGVKKRLKPMGNLKASDFPLTRNTIDRLDDWIMELASRHARRGSRSAPAAADDGSDGPTE